LLISLFIVLLLLESNVKHEKQMKLGISNAPPPSETVPPFSGYSC